VAAGLDLVWLGVAGVIEWAVDLVEKGTREAGFCL
jgi:hypothetical protein